MALILTFLLGIGNFAAHQAVLHSRHPVLAHPAIARLSGRVSLAAEFAVLLGALLLVGNGNRWWVWVYAGYSLFNALSAWLITTRRI